jgi:hypothetical protein
MPKNKEYLPRVLHTRVQYSLLCSSELHVFVAPIAAGRVGDHQSEFGFGVRHRGIGVGHRGIGIRHRGI